MKKALVLSLVLATAAVLSTGCASQGNQSLKKETEASVQGKIKEGQTTKASIKTMFGSPATTSFTDGGKEIWTYELNNISADAIEYIPVVNWFGSSYSGKKKQLVVMFNGDTVSKFSMSESDVSAKSGLFK